MRDRPDDDELMAAIARGEETAFAMLLERHLDRVRAIAWRMLGSADAADDVAQDVFMRIWARPRAYDPARGRFVSWLSRVAANACIDRLRRNEPGRLDEAAADRLVDPAPDPERRAMQSETAERVRAAVSALPERQRLAIVLSHDLGHTNIEIASIMDTTVEAVESLLGRARRRLKAQLREELAAGSKDEGT